MNDISKNREAALSKLRGICRVAAWVCKVAFLAIAAWSILGIVLMCWSIATSNIESNLLPLAISKPFLFFLYSADTCLVPIVIGRMLSDISRDRTPFNAKNTKRLLFLGFILLLYALFDFLLKTIDAQFSVSIASNLIEVGALVPDLSSDAETMINFFPVIIAGAFFALSAVVEYGVLLQQESDETL